MSNFWDYNVWSSLIIVAILLLCLLIANILKSNIKFLKKSLVPTPVLAGIMLFAFCEIFHLITGYYLFDTAFFDGSGYTTLENLAYHALALGFIATSLKSTNKKLSKQRSKEVFDTGVTTVSSYLLQGVFGLGVTIIAALIIPGFFKAAGVLLPFGYGQGTGQALNYGRIFETWSGSAGKFEGGANFGLTVAAFGFLSASIGGVIHLSIVKRKNPVLMERVSDRKASKDVVISGDDSSDGSLGKLTMQILLVVLAYAVTYLAMWGLSALVPSLQSVIYGFNFLFGVLAAVAIKSIIKGFRKKNVIKSSVTNNYLLSSMSNFFFDLMIVAGIGAIRLDIIGKYWAVLLIMGVVGALVTYFYNKFVAKKLFPTYSEEQFLAMYGMLTGTASTGVVLLREIDPNFTTDAANNLVYQTLPAIVFGFPMMLLATFAPENPYLTLIIMAGMFIVMNIILFRANIFKRKKKASDNADNSCDTTKENPSCEQNVES